MILLRRNHRWAKHVSSVCCFEKSIRRHKLGRFENDVAIARQGCTIRMGAITQFCVKDRMRLLPDQQWPNRRRTIATFGSDHLGPARARIALSSGAVAGTRKDQVVPTETLFQQRQTIPKSKVCGMPPMHLQMKLAIPTVAGESGFLGRY